MKKTIALLTLAAALAAPMAAQAHRAWMAPTATTLSGTDAWVGFDAGMSNQVFNPDHAAMRMTGLTITAPDGSTIQPEHMMQGQYRTTFDAHLTQNGTYKIANVMTGVMASYKLNGEQKRWRGTAAEYPSGLPQGATDVQATRTATRIETFVTLNNPTDAVFKPTGEGLELVPTTHPNDLVAGEAATFKLLNNGQPAANLDVTVARGGIRYRDNPEEMTVKTDAQGAFTVTWPEPGMYWLNAAVRTEGQGETPGSSASYVAAVEVLP